MDQFSPVQLQSQVGGILSFRPAPHCNPRQVDGGCVIYLFKAGTKEMPDHFEEEVLTEQGWVALQRGWRQPKQSKKTKNKVLGQMLYPKISCRGLFFFWVFFSRSFWFLTRKRSSATGLRKKSKNSKEIKKHKKVKVLGEILYPKISSRGLSFCLCFVLFFLSKCFDFWFMILCGIKTQTTIFGHYNSVSSCISICHFMLTLRNCVV